MPLTLEPGAGRGICIPSVERVATPPRGVIGRRVIRPCVRSRGHRDDPTLPFPGSEEGHSYLIPVPSLDSVRPSRCVPLREIIRSKDGWGRLFRTFAEVQSGSIELLNLIGSLLIRRCLRHVLYRIASTCSTSTRSIFGSSQCRVTVDQRSISRSILGSRRAPGRCRAGRRRRASGPAWRRRRRGIPRARVCAARSRR